MGDVSCVTSSVIGGISAQDGRRLWLLDWEPGPPAPGHGPLMICPRSSASTAGSTPQPRALSLSAQVLSDSDLTAAAQSPSCHFSLYSLQQLLWWEFFTFPPALLSWAQTLVH